MPSAAVLSLLLASLLWGSSFVVAKNALAFFHPMTLMFLRMLAAAIAFCPLIPSLRKVKVARRDLPLFLIMFLCEPCLYFICESNALRHTSASQAGMIIAAQPLFTAAGAWLFFRERSNVRVWIGIFLTIAGVIWISFAGGGTEAAPNPPLGNILEVGAAVAASTYAVASKRVSRSYPPLFLAALQAAAGVLFFGPAVLISGAPLPAVFEPGPFLSVVYLGVIITMAAFALYNYGLSRLPAPRAIVFLNVIPVFTLIMSFIFLGEHFSAGQWAASALVLGGVFLCQQRKADA